MKLTAIYNTHKVFELNEFDKEKGIRNYFRMLYDDFNIRKQPLSHKGCCIKRDLSSYGGIDTKNYNLYCLSFNNKIEIYENGICIYKSSKHNFNAKMAYCNTNFNPY